MQLTTGSSPRVRGTSLHQSALRAQTRFIPARAGNIPDNRAIGRSLSVHPRACGEHSYLLDRRYLHYGSSPRVRGTY